MNRCVFPGSFNPFTVGHYEIVLKSLKKYDEVIVAVADETYKADMLALSCRVDIARKSLADTCGVTVIGFKGLLTDFLAEYNVFKIVRGLRRDDDTDYEQSLMQIYKKMDGRTEVEYFFSDNEHISSSLARRIAKEGGRLKGLVLPQVIDDIKRLYS